MDFPVFRVELPLCAHQLLESNVLVVELAQQSQLVDRCFQELISLQGFVVLADHFIVKGQPRKILIILKDLKHRIQATLLLAGTQNLTLPLLKLPFSISLKVDILLSQVKLTQHYLILLLQRYLVKLVAYSKREFSVLELEKLGQKLLIPKDLVFCHPLNKLLHGQSHDSLVKLCDSKVDADEHYLLIAEEIFWNIAMDIENSSAKLILLLSFDGSPDSGRDLIKVRMQPFLKFAVS